MKLEFLVPKKTTRDQSYFNEIVADTEPLPFLTPHTTKLNK